MTGSARRASPAVRRCSRRTVPLPARVASAGPGAAGVFTAARRAPKHGRRSVAAADLDLVNLRRAGAADRRTGAAGAGRGSYARESWRASSGLRGAFAVALWDRPAGAFLLAVDHFGMRRLYYAITPATGSPSRPGRAALLAVLAASKPRWTRPRSTTISISAIVPAPRSRSPGHPAGPPGLPADHRATARWPSSPYWDLEYPERRRCAARPSPRPRAHGGGGGGGAPSAAGAGQGHRAPSCRAAPTAARCSAHGPAHAASGSTPSPSASARSAMTSCDYARPGRAPLRRRPPQAHRVTPDEALEALPRLVEAYDEPFGNNSAIGTYLCARLARECGISRLLAGDGGDEIFGGNERYASGPDLRALSARSRAPAPRASRADLLGSSPTVPRTAVGRAQRYVRRASIPNPRRFYSYEFYFAAGGPSASRPGLPGRRCDLEAPVARSGGALRPRAAPPAS